MKYCNRSLQKLIWRNSETIGFRIQKAHNVQKPSLAKLQSMIAEIDADQ